MIGLMAGWTGGWINLNQLKIDRLEMNVEWMKESINEWMNWFMTGWMNERINERMN